MKKLEPTYLRYVYDGLSKGSLNAENASDLPYGFIDLFEKEFSANISLNKRTYLLRRLTHWALFKGSVSTHLASKILKEDELDTKILIDKYSKWFNSPEPGKFILYHDRLRTYFLQKISYHEIQSINNKIISFLDASLKDRKLDEANEYALEHLANHMAFDSQLGGNYDRLHNFVNQESLWKRQVMSSKEYNWSQQAVQYAIKEGARRKLELNTLISTVNSVKLMQDEQNSVQQILDIFNEGDYITALDRVLNFKEKERFVIYLLMMHEITVGSVKNLDNKHIICENILNSLSDNVSIEISIYDSEINFPVEAIHTFHNELCRMNIRSNIIWERGGRLDYHVNYNSNKYHPTIKFIEYLISKKVSYENLFYTFNTIGELKINSLIVLLNEYLTDIQNSKDIFITVDEVTGDSLYTISKRNDLLKLIISGILEIKVDNKKASNERDVQSKKISYFLDVYEILVNFSNQKLNDIKDYIENYKILIKNLIIETLKSYGWHTDLTYYDSIINLIDKDNNDSFSSSDLIDDLFSLIKRYKLEDKDVFSHYQEIGDKLLKANAFEHVFKLYVDLLAELDKRKFKDDFYYFRAVSYYLTIVTLVSASKKTKARNLMKDLKEIFDLYSVYEKFMSYYRKESLNKDLSKQATHLIPAKDFLDYVIEPKRCPNNYFDILNHGRVSSDFYVYYSDSDKIGENENTNFIKLSEIIDISDEFSHKTKNDLEFENAVKYMDLVIYRTISTTQVVDYEGQELGNNLEDLSKISLALIRNNNNKNKNLVTSYINYVPRNFWQSCDSIYLSDTLLEFDQEILLEELKGTVRHLTQDYKIVKKLIVKSQLENAIKKIDLIDNYILSLDLRLKVLNHYHTSNHINLLNKSLSELILFVEGLEYSFRKSLGYMMIAEALSLNGDIERFHKIYDNITDKDHKVLRELFLIKLLIESDKTNYSYLKKINELIEIKICEVYEDKFNSALASISRALFLKNKKSDFINVNKLIKSETLKGFNLLYFWEHNIKNHDIIKSDRIFQKLIKKIDFEIDYLFEGSKLLLNDNRITFLLKSAHLFSLYGKIDISCDIISKIFGKCSLTDDYIWEHTQEYDFLFDIINYSGKLIEKNNSNELGSLISNRLDTILSNAKKSLKNLDSIFLLPFLNSVISHIYFVKSDLILAEKYAKDCIKSLKRYENDPGYLSESTEIHDKIKSDIYSECFLNGYHLDKKELSFVRRSAIFESSFKNLESLINNKNSKERILTEFKKVFKLSKNPIEFENLYNLMDFKIFPEIKDDIVQHLDDRFSFSSGNYNNFLKIRIRKFYKGKSEIDSFLYDPVIEHLINNGRIDEGINLARYKKTGGSNDEALLLALAKNNHFDIALDYLNNFFDSHDASNLLSKIAITVANMGDVKKSLSISELIATDVGEETCKSDAYAAISTHLMKKGDVNYAIQISNLISNDSTAISNYQNLCKICINDAIENKSLQINKLLEPIVQNWFKVFRNSLSYEAFSSDEIKSRFLYEIVDANINIANHYLEKNDKTKYGKIIDSSIDYIENVKSNPQLSRNWDNYSFCELYIKIAQDLSKNNFNKKSELLTKKAANIAKKYVDFHEKETIKIYDRLNENLQKMEYSYHANRIKNEIKQCLNILKLNPLFYDELYAVILSLTDRIIEDENYNVELYYGFGSRDLKSFRCLKSYLFALIAEELIVLGKKSQAIELYNKSFNVLQHSKESKQEYLMIGFSMIKSYSQNNFSEFNLIDNFLEMISKYIYDEDFFLKIIEDLLVDNKKNHAFILSKKIIINNFLSKRVKTRNDRLQRLISMHAPEIIIKHEKKLTQESIDKLCAFSYCIILLFKEKSKAQELTKIFDSIILGFNKDYVNYLDVFKSNLLKEKKRLKEIEEAKQDKFVRSISNIGDFNKTLAFLEKQLQEYLIDNDIKKVNLLEKVLDLSAIKNTIKI